jgi:hypothetical protein
MKPVAGEIVLEKNAKEQSVAQPQVDAGIVKSFLDELETKLDESTKTIEKLQEAIGVLRVAEENLAFLRAYGLKIDQIGNFPHIFVKVGFINSASLPRLMSFTGGTSVVVVSETARPRENLLAISARYNRLDLLARYETGIFKHAEPEHSSSSQQVTSRVRIT